MVTDLRAENYRLDRELTRLGAENARLQKELDVFRLIEEAKKDWVCVQFPVPDVGCVFPVPPEVKAYIKEMQRALGFYADRGGSVAIDALNPSVGADREGEGDG